MSDTHLEFDRATVPLSEAHNEVARSDFDWAAVFRECDAELIDVESGLADESRKALEHALGRTLRWVFAAHAYQGRSSMDAAIGRRAIALGIRFSLFPERNLSEVARQLGITRQSLCEAVGKVPGRFDRAHEPCHGPLKSEWKESFPGDKAAGTSSYPNSHACGQI